MRRSRQVSWTEAEFLQAQVVVLLGLADPVHADASNRRHGASVGWPHDRDDLFNSLFECPPRQCQASLGSVALAPRIRAKLPADLELLVWRQRKQGGPADHMPVLPELNRPPASRRPHACVLGDPLLQHQAHGRQITNRIHLRSQPSRHLSIAVRAQRRPGIIDAPRAQDETFGDQSVGHRLTIAGPSESDTLASATLRSPVMHDLSAGSSLRLTISDVVRRAPTQDEILQNDRIWAVNTSQATDLHPTPNGGYRVRCEVAGPSLSATTPRRSDVWSAPSTQLVRGTFDDRIVGDCEGMKVTSFPELVSAEKWQQARDELLNAEKEATRALDALAARRRRLPMVKFDNTRYVFGTSAGPKTLLDLFAGQRQLVVYQFMDNGPDDYCPGCTRFTSNVVDLATLADAGVSWATVSDMPLAQIEAYKARMGWTVPFVSSHGTTFAGDCGAGDGFMLSMFLRDSEDIYRTYCTTARGVDRLLFVNNILDLTPYGRQADWEDSPPGWPQHPTYG